MGSIAPDAWMTITMEAPVPNDSSVSTLVIFELEALPLSYTRKMSGPRPWIGDPEAPTTLTQARARIPRGQVPLSICTCWIDSCGPAACAASGSAAAIAAQNALGCLITMDVPFILRPVASDERFLASM